MPDHDDDPDFAPMPMPPGAGAPPPSVQADWEAAEWYATNRLDRTFGCKDAMLAGTLYRSRAGDDCRARRIFSPRPAKADRGKFDGGDTAHIVRLPESPLDNGADLPALCGEYLRAGRKWSGIRAFATCYRCRTLTTPQPSSIVGWKHKMAETQWLKVAEMVACYSFAESRWIIAAPRGTK